MSNLISREAALKVVCDTCPFVSCSDDDKCDEYEAMKNLPSVDLPNDFLEFLFQVINPNRMETYLEMYHCIGEATDG